jgi:hypothetical protein
MLRSPPFASVTVLYLRDLNQKKLLADMVARYAKQSEVISSSGWLASWTDFLKMSLL